MKPMFNIPMLLLKITYSIFTLNTLISSCIEAKQIRKLLDILGQLASMANKKSIYSTGIQPAIHCLTSFPEIPGVLYNTIHNVI